MKMARRTLATPITALILLAAAGFAYADRDSDRDGRHDSDKGSHEDSDHGSGHDSGQPAGLQLGAQVAGTACTATGASANIDLALIAGSAAPVTFYVSIAGGAFTNAGTSRDWTSIGRTKTMEESLAVVIPANGLGVQVRICGQQPGSNGNDNRSACTAVNVGGVLCSTGPGGPT